MRTLFIAPMLGAIIAAGFNNPASAVTCTVTGRPSCTVTCSTNGCRAQWNDPPGACYTSCFNTKSSATASGQFVNLPISKAPKVGKRKKKKN